MQYKAGQRAMILKNGCIHADTTVSKLTQHGFVVANSARFDPKTGQMVGDSRFQLKVYGDGRGVLTREPVNRTVEQSVLPDAIIRSIENKCVTFIATAYKSIRRKYRKFATCAEARLWRWADWTHKATPYLMVVVFVSSAVLFLRLAIALSEVVIGR